MVETWRLWVGFAALAMTWVTVVSNNQALVKPTLIAWGCAIMPSGF